MKISVFIRKITLLLSMLCTLAINAAEEESTADLKGMRTWTSKKGDALTAAYEKTLHNTVYLKKESGETIKIKKSALSAADQTIVGGLSESAITKTLLAKKTESLPKAPPELYEMFGDRLRTANNKPVSVDTLADKVIGVYFSAHWCPPCRAFTPELVKFYDKLNQDGKPFEIVFVSSDRSKDAMYAYMKEMKMKWLALPYGDARKALLSAKFGVSGIPMFVVLNSKGEVITKNGRSEVMNGVKVFANWEKK